MDLRSYNSFRDELIKLASTGYLTAIHPEAANQKSIRAKDMRSMGISHAQKLSTKSLQKYIQEYQSPGKKKVTSPRVPTLAKTLYTQGLVDEFNARQAKIEKLKQLEKKKNAANKSR
tara:strand:- start:128 stop:478 length:351 start_codon:yes stop_codon:yes gene_type:complete